MDGIGKSTLIELIDLIHKRGSKTNSNQQFLFKSSSEIIKYMSAFLYLEYLSLNMLDIDHLNAFLKNSKFKYLFSKDKINSAMSYQTDFYSDISFYREGLREPIEQYFETNE